MNLKKILNLNNYEFWQNHKRVITYGGFLVLLAVYFFPIVEQARQNNKDTIYLLVLHNLYASGSEAVSPPTWLVPMKSMDQCETAGRKLLEGKKLKGHGRYIFYDCINGK